MLTSNAHGTQRRLKSIATAGREGHRQQLSATRLRGFVVPVPPLAEQRKIVGVLGLVQRAMEQQEGLIALTTELEKGAPAPALHPRPSGRTSKTQPKSAPCRKSWEVVAFGKNW